MDRQWVEACPHDALIHLRKSKHDLEQRLRYGEEFDVFPGAPHGFNPRDQVVGDRFGFFA